MAGSFGQRVKNISTPFAKGKKTSKIVKNIRAGFRQNGFFADFYFWDAGCFRGFSRRIFSPHFCGKSAQKNPPGKSPGKSSKIYTTKILQHISADCPGQKIFSKHFFDTFRAAPISRPLLGGSDPESSDLAPSTRKLLAIAIVRFWCAK